jgi:hypothetical protein
MPVQNEIFTTELYALFETKTYLLTPANERRWFASLEPTGVTEKNISILLFGK